MLAFSKAIMGIVDSVKKYVRKKKNEIVNSVTSEVKTQRKKIINEFYDALDPINERLDELETGFQKGINSAIQPLKTEIDEIDDLIDSIRYSVEENFNSTIEPLLDSVEDTKKLMANIQDEFNDIPAEISSRFMGFYSSIQDLIQTVLDAIAQIDPLRAFKEVRGTLKIIISLILFFFVLIQLAPQILLKFIF